MGIPTLPWSAVKRVTKLPSFAFTAVAALFVALIVIVIAMVFW